MTTIILAAGLGTRWMATRATTQGGVLGVSPEFKQMLDIGGEPNILRTTRILREAGEFRIIILANPMLKTALKDFPEMVIAFHDSERPLLSRIVDSVNCWFPSSRVNFLHGDVVFSRDTIKKIIDCKTSFSSFGRFGPNQFTGKTTPELFAITASEVSYGYLFSLCGSLSEPEKASSKFWELRNLMGALGYSPNDADQKIFDWTDDIDSAEEYIEFYPKLVELALHEEDLHRKELMNGHK